MSKTALSYHLCPQCARAVPAQSGELFCANDGTKLLTSCPGCARAILSPYWQFCPLCGRALASASVPGG
ncbi:double zinc ribbon domain-containing protein [Deinococcus hohokamensis]|uniref:Zinc ribbon domain-containing protein n=1 Tax=Deinococcus hohokamensis TaxID=309883 RepID=A0ABV9I9F3_9DEIO